jgi:hypothetical protein
MLDERDALLVREFAQSQRPLADAQFVAQVIERLPFYSLERLLAVAASGVVEAIITAFSFGVAAPLKMRHSGPVAFAALGLALWSIVTSSL